MLFVEAFRTGEVLRLPSSSLSPARSRGCREALLEADALRAIQPQPNSVALSKSSAQDILSLFFWLKNPRHTGIPGKKMRADNSVSNNSPTVFNVQAA
jgi:hypothetical protein